MGLLPRLAITGASGFVARYVMRALKTQYRFVALDRHPRMESQVPPDGEVEWHQVDLGDRDRTLATFRRITARGGAEALIHLAAHYDFTGEDDPEYWRTNVAGLRNVLDGCRGLRLGHFVFASSLAACAFPGPGEALTEDTQPGGCHVYARTKRIGEEMLGEYRDDFPSTIVRFAALYSDWCEYLPLYFFLGKWLSKRWDARVLGGRGGSAIPFLHVRDAALFLRAVLEHREALAPGKVVIASPDRIVSHLDLYRAATRAFFGSAAPEPRFMPRALCRPGMWVLDELGRRFGERPFERPWMAQYIDREMRVDGSRTRAVLGWEPRLRLEILRRMPFLVENFRTDPVEWHRRNQQFLALRRQLPNLRVYQLLLDHRDAIVWRLDELMTRRAARRRMPRYQELSPEERHWNHRMILRNLLHAVRSRRKGLFMAYCRDLAERRAALGFPASEVVHALSNLHRACREALAGDPEVAELKPELRDTVSQTIRFGIDQVQMVYEAIQGEADRRARIGRKPPDPPVSTAARLPERRTVVHGLVALLGLSWLTGSGAGGCSGGSPGETGETDQDATPVLEIPLAALPPGERVRVVHGQRPVELRREGEGVVARSLLCTHFGCEVRWDGERELYACPCHEGAFGPDGRVVAGPPPRPLAELPVRIEGSRVVLGGDRA